MSVQTGVFAYERAFENALKTEEKIGLILDGGDDNGAKSYVLACKAIGENLVSKHCGFGMGHAHIFHSALKCACKGLAAIGVGNNSKRFCQRLCKAFYAWCVIVRNERGLNAVLFELCKPFQNAFVGVWLLVGGEGVVNINQKRTHANGL